MKDVILEIMQGVEIANANKHYEPPGKRQKISARLIADMVQKFVEWKDNNWVEYNKIEKKYYYHYSHSGFYHFKTINDLFTYWHKNIYNIKDKKG